METIYFELDFLDGTTKVFDTEEAVHRYAREKEIVAYALNTYSKESERFNN